MNYNLDTNGSDVLKVSRAEKVSVRVQDKRNIEDPRLRIHKRNLDHDVILGGYLAEKSIVNIVKEGLFTSLKQRESHV